MTHAEQVGAALTHRAPDRIPIDFGGTAVTGIRKVGQQAVSKLLQDTEFMRKIAAILELDRK